VYQFSRFATEFQKNAISKSTIFSKPVLLITATIKKEYSHLSICDTNSGHSPAELVVTGDPDGTPAPVANNKFLFIPKE
jgi:hypothetical protein